MSQAVLERDDVADAAVEIPSIYVVYPRRPGYAPKGEGDDGLRCVRPVDNTCALTMARNDSSAAHLKWNKSWLEALELREERGITHYAMCHDDIQPSPCWASKQFWQKKRLGADIISAVVPLKDERGLTSTAIMNLRNGLARRLSMKEVFELPETFDISDVHEAGIFACREHASDEILGVNLGLWVCRIAGETWVEPPHFNGFHMRDGIIRQPDGRLRAFCVSEDYNFSILAARLGLKVMATRIVPLGHWNLPNDMDRVGQTMRIDETTFAEADGKIIRSEGTGLVRYFDEAGKLVATEYRNDSVWGTCETDPCDE